MTMSQLSHLDAFLPEAIRTQIEQRYYAQINQQALFEQVRNDPEFLHHPRTHVALFSDHGVVHVRDVATQVLQIIDTIPGVLIPARDRSRLAFMKGYGVILAYLHDIGMVNFSRFGRAIHPEFASQTVFSRQFEPIMETIWAENCGNIAWRLSNLAADGVLIQPPQTVLREILAMVNCHSKSKVPIETLNDPLALRHLMWATITTDLWQLYQQHSEKASQLKLLAAPARNSAALLENLHRHYAGSMVEPYEWLISSRPEAQALVADVVDTLRILRCADALRQRGTVLKTSGSDEIFVDQRSGNAIFALRNGQTALFLLELPDPISAGEANIAGSELNQEGNLRVSFHRGAFASPDRVQWAAYAAALMVNDIQSDVIGSFQRAAGTSPPDIKPAQEMQILLEGVDDNLEFTNLVLEELNRINPEAGARTFLVSSLQHSTDFERELYLQASPLTWSLAERQELLARINQTGHKTSGIDPETGFKEVKLVELELGQVLVEANTPASFVYIPLDDGLQVIPLGGYAPFSVRAWMALGITGVIRGAKRNATVIAERPVRLLMMPKEVYLRHWHQTYSQEEFVSLLQSWPETTAV